MLILGRVLIALGIPSRKSIWTASYVLLAMGWSILALSVLYVITDIWRLRRGLGLFILYGQFALTAYLLGETTFRSLVTHLGKKITVGLPHLLGTDRYQDLALKISAIFIITIVLLIRRKIKART
jgi:predicted acyltransferase